MIADMKKNKYTILNINNKIKIKYIYINQKCM